jgi:DNA-binding NarL/FixJ family response regulator
MMMAKTRKLREVAASNASVKDANTRNWKFTPAYDRDRPVRIIVTDNRRLCRECLRLLIETFDPTLEVVEANDPKEILVQLGSSDEQSVVLYNLVLPGEEGLDYVAKLHDSIPDIPLIVLCDFDDPELVAGALYRGAKAFLPSTTPSPVMVAVLHLVIAGGVYAPPGMILSSAAPGPMAGEVATPAAREASIGKLFPNLTPRQGNVLALLSEGRTNKAIADSLGMCENTVKAHVKHIMRKLLVNNRTEAALMADRLVSRRAAAA